MQTLPTQHPVGQDFALQTQLPPMQTWPREHAAPAPHPHEPEAVHMSAVVTSHAVHAPPAEPQRLVVGG